MARFIDAEQIVLKLDHDLSVEDLDIALKLSKLIKEQPAAQITCSKCHGIGTYKIPIFDEDAWELSKMSQDCICELCHGSGKIDIDFYEELQRKVRED